MTSVKRWLLPDGVEDILPSEAYELESLRRQLLDLFGSWGYELVIPPLIEFLDSLLVDAPEDLDLHTFKVTDQISGKMMGVRADVTLQAARIDAHTMNRDGQVRLCYADNVLHTRPRGIMTSRVPIRLGAELYGYAGTAADVELICLMAQTLDSAGIPGVQIVLGHVGIFKALVYDARLNAAAETQLFEAAQRKAYDEFDLLLEKYVQDSPLKQQFKELIHLSGDESVLVRALKAFAAASEAVTAELKELTDIVRGIKRRLGEVTLHFDLCELRGYEYHTGIVFAAYINEYGRAVAKGGRYDHIGKAFGRARPASGFDTDLKVLSKLSGKAFARPKGILAPDSEEPSLALKVSDLRSQGVKVVTMLGAEDVNRIDADTMHCDRRLIKRGAAWIVE
ncbi:MAG: ATP phosphoribosyltransferase regulatory subunit [Gammaproteobacteria bacterium]|mgnify:CR=1 FL=1|nr:ATP phosphoribosyltransferase regulatory subunit [Gammaproteobacteria bacterium]HBW82530.1 ATP phosphoribosyltransferase regulatory subunit [Gammaproteobacteria bacterium]|tara:strand:- start:6863 stop:8047 length:1185 start_codon:yes stop_codon:yes gene_type:complete